jgi:hypothetical protein
MTFEQALIASRYHYQPECGAFWKEDKNQNVHTYLELENGRMSSMMRMKSSSRQKYSL